MSEITNLNERCKTNEPVLSFFKNRFEAAQEFKIAIFQYEIRNPDTKEHP